jgi:8-hydroxy-5-deazaflavin:NADPH oxidoreductase
MRIGILGAGNIGRSLGAPWAKLGHEILYGVRDPASPKILKALEVGGANARAATIREAAEFGEVIVLAVPWAAVRETLSQAGDLAGKTLIDATNRIAAPATGEESSAGATVAKWAPGARVVKAFNTLGWETIADPIFGNQRATAFVCGDDGAAKEIVMQLAREAGLTAADAGGLDNAALLESMTRLWIGMTRRYGRNIAFALLER